MIVLNSLLGLKNSYIEQKLIKKHAILLFKFLYT